MLSAGKEKEKRKKEKKKKGEKKGRVKAESSIPVCAQISILIPAHYGFHLARFQLPCSRAITRTICYYIVDIAMPLCLAAAVG